MQRRLTTENWVSGNGHGEGKGYIWEISQQRHRLQQRKVCVYLVFWDVLCKDDSNVGDNCQQY